MDALSLSLERKSQLDYEINSIEKYIKEGNCDLSLQHIWEKLTGELKEVEVKIDRLTDPSKKAVELKIMTLQHEIKGHELRIEKLKHEISDLEKMIE